MERLWKMKGANSIGIIGPEGPGTIAVRGERRMLERETICADPVIIDIPKNPETAKKDNILAMLGSGA